MPGAGKHSRRGELATSRDHDEAVGQVADFLRGQVRDVVREFVPASAREVESRSRILADLEALGRPFDRDGGPVHVTGSGFVLGRRGTVLLVHKKLGTWMQPGGHVDPGETPSDAALREVTEETGLAVHHPQAGPCLLHLDVHPAAEDHVHLDLRYLLICEEDADPTPAEGESRQVNWFGFDDALAIAGPDPGLVDGLGRLKAASSSFFTRPGPQGPN